MFGFVVFRLSRAFLLAAGRAVGIENCVEPGEQYVQLETG